MRTTYHATIFTNDKKQLYVQSIGMGLRREQAERIVYDLNTALTVLGQNAYAKLVKEEN